MRRLPRGALRPPGGGLRYTRGYIPPPLPGRKASGCEQLDGTAAGYGFLCKSEYRGEVILAVRDLAPVVSFRQVFFNRQVADLASRLVVVRRKLTNFLPQRDGPRPVLASFVQL